MIFSVPFRLVLLPNIYTEPFLRQPRRNIVFRRSNIFNYTDESLAKGNFCVPAEEEFLLKKAQFIASLARAAAESNE